MPPTKCTHEGLCDNRDPKCVSYARRSGWSPGEVRQQIQEALLEYETENPGTFVGISTFEDWGVMSRDEGLVLVDDEGGEWQVTVVRSR
jgi:hypothetical protein